MTDNIIFISNNIAIDQSQSLTSLIPPTINVKDLLEFYGTIFLPTAQSKPVIENPSTNIKSLFGAWVESGDEDSRLEEIYESRQVPSGVL